MHVFIVQNIPRVPLSEKEPIPDSVAEDVAEKTQRKLKYICLQKYLICNY